MWLVGWLFWALRHSETVFQSISGRLPERGRKRREMIDEGKMSKQPPPAPTASTIGPCPTITQISRTPQHWKFTHHLRTTRPPSQCVVKPLAFYRGRVCKKVSDLISGYGRVVSTAWTKMAYFIAPFLISWLFWA